MRGQVFTARLRPLPSPSEDRGTTAEPATSKAALRAAQEPDSAALSMAWQRAAACPAAAPGARPRARAPKCGCKPLPRLAHRLVQMERDNAARIEPVAFALHRDMLV